MLENMRGRVALILAETDFDVDQIVGIVNTKVQDPELLAKLVLEWCDDEFAQRLQPGDFIVAGLNFGYGHPHYPTMIGMRHLGLAAVLGESFSPGYWLGEISKGFPQVACPGILAGVNRWDEVEIDWASAVVTNLTQGTTLPFQPLTTSEMNTLAAGGFLKYLLNN